MDDVSTFFVFGDMKLYRDIPGGLRELIEPIVADHGCELVDAETLGGQGAQVLRQSRPTAVNLFWAVERMLKRLSDPTLVSVQAVTAAALAEAEAIAAEDVKINKQIGRNALPLIPQKATIIHHCNTGSLATVDYGTALGIIRMAHEEGKDVFALVAAARVARHLDQVDRARRHYLRALELRPSLDDLRRELQDLSPGDA